jgi:hypothetical protein
VPSHFRKSFVSIPANDTSDKSDKNPTVGNAVGFEARIVVTECGPGESGTMMKNDST